VQFTGVIPPNGLSDYQTALGYIDYRVNPYNLVPLTFDLPTQTAVINDVLLQSSQMSGSYRACFLGLQGQATQVIASPANTSDGNPVMATVGDNPGVSGNQYTYLTVTSGNIQFVSGAIPVRVGDSVHYVDVHSLKMA
jgi:hypothetical protein